MEQNIVVDGKKIGRNSPVYIVAEMSANHLQDKKRAKEIIKAAKESGADAVKLQTYRPDTLTIDCPKKEFLASAGGPWSGMYLYELYAQAYLPWEWHGELFDYAKEIGITCFSAPFDLTAVDFLRRYHPAAYKIASYEITDIPLIRKTAREGMPVLISTGIAKLPDIALAVEACRQEGNEKIVLLKCVSAYPAPYEEFHLRTIRSMGELFGCVGLSDHSPGDCIAIAAAALGAKLIEKHFTLSRKDGGPDAAFSMEPKEFEKMAVSIRNVEKAVGCAAYSLTKRQSEERKGARSLYAAEDIKKGERLSETNVRSVRPGYGISPKDYDAVLLKRANRDLKKGTALKWEYLD